MKDLQEQLEKLRTGAAECKSVRDLSTDLQKQELFARLAEHLDFLASEIERVIAANISAGATERREA
jgi:hypothetical protein